MTLMCHQTTRTPETAIGHLKHALSSEERCNTCNGVEVMGRYLNPSDQGERLRQVLEMVPSGLRPRFIEPLSRFIAGSSPLSRMRLSTVTLPAPP